MEIVIEYVFFENFVINYFIFSCCGAMFKIKPKWSLISCTFGSVMALFFPLFNFPIYLHIFATMLVGLIMTCISFPIKTFKDLLFFYFGFIFLTFVFGGGSYLVSSWFGQTSLLIICLTSFALFIAVKLFLKKYAKRKALDNFKCSVQISCNGVAVEEVGYIDSANMLYDPLTSSPIVLISKEVFEKLVGTSYVYFLMQKDKIKSLPLGHYVSVNSAVSNGKMMVFMAEKLTIIEKGSVREFENQMLGVSISNFSKTFSSGVLIHSELAV